MSFEYVGAPSTLISKGSSTKYRNDDAAHEPNTEIELDLRGRKHVDKQDNADGVYMIQKDTGSSFIFFPLPGKASADAFRTFLKGHLTQDLITDEYGYITPITQVLDDHLPTLQAQLWMHKLDDAAHTLSDMAMSAMPVNKCGRFVQHRSNKISQLSEDNNTVGQSSLLASYFTFIVGLLQSRHIFIHRKKVDRICEFPTCKHRANAKSPAPFTVSLEPLIHWGSVTLATDLLLCRGRVQVFRRDGEKCDDPLWTQAIKGLSPPSLPAYCSDCLQVLMDNRMRIMAFLGWGAGTSFTAVNAQNAQLLGTRGPKDRDGFHQDVTHHITSRHDPKCLRIPTRKDDHRGFQDDLSDQSQAALRNLDGTCDALHDQHTHNASESDCSPSLRDDKASPYRGESDSPVGECASSATEASPPRKPPLMPISIARLQGTFPQVSTGTSTWAMINKSPFVPSSPLNNRIYFDPDSQPAPLSDSSKLENSKAQISQGCKATLIPICVNASSTLLPGAKRKFGRELDANTVNRPQKKSTDTIKSVRMSAPYTKDEPFQKRASSSSSLQTPHEAKEARSKSPRSTPPSYSSGHDASDDWDSTGFEGPNLWDSYLAHAAKSSILPPINPKSPPKKKTPPCGKQAAPKDTAQSTPTLGPFFAKRPPTSCPDTISPPTWTAYQTRVPPTTEIMCYCHCRAPTSTPIAQCSNPSCAIQWFHYDCLDKSQKISCRYGRLVCQHCRNTLHFSARDVENGWSVEKMVSKEMDMPVTGQEMVAAMPGLGGGYGVERAYGLGTAGEDLGKLDVSENVKGALGALEFFGYVESRPFVVAEAYMNAHAYAHLREEVGAEEDEEFGDEEEEYYEYDVEDDEEPGEEDDTDVEIIVD